MIIFMGITILHLLGVSLESLSYLILFAGGLAITGAVVAMFTATGDEVAGI